MMPASAAVHHQTARPGCYRPGARPGRPRPGQRLAVAAADTRHHGVTSGTRFEHISAHCRSHRRVDCQRVVKAGFRGPDQRGRLLDPGR